MTDTKPTRFRRVMTHLKDNAEIYVPVVIFVASVTTLAIIGTKVAKAAAEYDREAMEALAEAGEGARLLIDSVTGDYVIAAPVTN